MKIASASASASSSDYVHSHDFLGTGHDENAKRTLWVVILTVVMMVGEITTGYITGSMALLADGFHMATHAGALGIAAAAYVFARKHSTNNAYSFGTGKVGDLGGFASALILGLISIGIGVESVMRLLEPTRVQFGIAIWIAVIGLAVNIVSALLLSGNGGHDHGHGHDHHHGHSQSQDNNFRSAYVHVLADAVTSVLAIVALLAGKFLGWVWLDPAIGVVGAVVIARWAWSLMRDTASVLLDKTDEHVAEEIRDLLDQTGKLNITDLHVWRVGPDARAAIVSVSGSSQMSAADVREVLKPVHEVTHLTVEYRAA